MREDGKFFAGGLWCAVVMSLMGVGSECPGEGFGSLEEMVGKDGKGRDVYRALPVEEKYLIRWPEKMGEEFQERARGIIASQSAMPLMRGNTYFENEKRPYGYMMAQALGDGEEGHQRFQDIGVGR